MLLQVVDAFSKVVDNLGQAVRTQQVDWLASRCEIFCVHISSENSSVKSKAKDGAIGRQFHSLSIVFVCQEGAETSYFEIDSRL
jgi:hypothetical protein